MDDDFKQLVETDILSNIEDGEPVSFLWILAKKA